ncbi:MAG: DNA repair exonuclease [Promethearchaeota archaeon]|nr:MAG: DNA repair exonuclease [Candidatus Lokiarchaeota archaeon]
MTIENCFETILGNSIVLNDTGHDFVKFIHASDIHLGAVQYRNDYRSNDFIQAFQEILELAIKHHVDFILLGGDVFTSLEMLPGKLTKIVKILNDFKEFTNGTILIIAIEGNHDIRKFSRGIRFERRGQSWLKLLNNLGLIVLLDADLDALSEEIFELYNFDTKRGGKIQIKNVMIYGTRYLGEKPISFLSKIRKAIVKNDDLFNILLQHFGIEGQMENVPGINIEDIQHLKHRVNYLALGHFHKQFILENWIYNPGSSEAVCSVDNSFKRGVFLVEILKKFEKFEKKVSIIRLINRKYLWETIYLNNEFRNKKDIEIFILNRLSSSLKYLNFDIHPSNPQMPILYLILKGKEPSRSCRINEKDLKRKICYNLPLVDVKIYQKFRKPLKTLDSYILAGKS